MPTYTSNYGWTKPSGSDNVDISVLNDNLDDQDSTIHDAFLNMAPPFSESSTYAVDDIVLYTTGLYKCHTAVVTPGAWTGSTNWQVYKLSEGGGGGLTLGETSSTAYRGDRGKVAYDHSQTTGNPHGTTAADVGLGNVPNVSTNDQEPTFTEASTRNNIASGEKLSVIFGKIQKFFNDLKTVAFSGSYTDLTNTPTIPAAQVNSDWNASSGVAKILNKPSSYTPSSHKHGNIQNGGTLQTTDVDIANGDKLVVTDSSNSAKIARTSVAFDGTTTTQALSKKGTFETFSKFSGSYTDLTNQPQINGNTLTGNKTTSDLGINATNVMMSDGVTSVEDALGNYKVIKSIIADGVKTYQQILNELYSYSDDGMILMISSSKHYQLNKKQYFNVMENGDGVFKYNSIVLDANNSTYYRQPWGSTVSNYTNSVVTQGFGIKLIKYY